MAQSTCRRCGDPTSHHNRRYCSPGCELIDRHEVGENGCWEWQGSISPEGYGRIGWHGFAHRVSYEVFVGPIPDGLTLDHLCRNRVCMNPGHLEPVPLPENVMRALRIRPPIEACRAFGHPYGPDTYVNTKGRKVCRECRRMREGFYERPIRSTRSRPSDSPVRRTTAA